MPNFKLGVDFSGEMWYNKTIERGQTGSEPHPHKSGIPFGGFGTAPPQMPPLWRIRNQKRTGVLNRIPTKAVSQFGALADMCSAPMLLIVSVKQNVKNKLTAYQFLPPKCL